MAAFRSMNMSKLGLCVAMVLLAIGSFLRTQNREVTRQVPFTNSQHVRSLEFQSGRELLFGKDKLRVAVFGSSNSWGAGCEEETEGHFCGYPYKISPSVDNYADFAAGPNYPSVCTETLLGDDKVYDVILIEFWLRAHEGVGKLADRLHKRFPHAVIIFLKLWGPFHARRKPSQDSKEKAITFEQWIQTVQTDNNQINEKVNALAADDGFWFFPDHRDADMHINKAAHGVGGYQMHFPHEPTAKESLVHYLRFFDRHHHTHLNARGHGLVANLTKAIIHTHIESSQEETQVANAGRPGTWGKGDSCHLWITTGGCNLEYSADFAVKEFDSRRGKFSLEIASAGWIKVKNPFEETRSLYLSFMASDVPQQFPKLNIQYLNEHGESVTGALDPDHSSDRKHAGVTRTVSIGEIPSGYTTINVQPVGAFEKPFRLVGSSFTDDEAVPWEKYEALPLEYGFGPVFNQ